MTCTSTLARVGMASQGRKGTVNLLGQHHPSQFVRERHARKREQEVGARGPSGWEAVVAADYEDEVAALLFGAGNNGGELRRIDGAPRGIEENLAGSRVALPDVGAAGADLAHFGRGITGGAVHEIGGECVGVAIFRFADEVEEDLHAAGISTSLAL